MVQDYADSTSTGTDTDTPSDEAPVPRVAVLIVATPSVAGKPDVLSGDSADGQSNGASTVTGVGYRYLLPLTFKSPLYPGWWKTIHTAPSNTRL